MNALLLCKIWSNALNLKNYPCAIDSEERAGYLVAALKQENLEDAELEKATAYIYGNLTAIEELMQFSGNKCCDRNDKLVPIA